jgi:hypothetical protein
MAFWGDLFDLGKERAKDEITNLARSIGTDRDAHIPYQEAAQGEIFALGEAVAVGSISPAYATARIREINRAFRELANQVGHSRAAAGARDVDATAITVLGRIGGEAGGPIAPTAAAMPWGLIGLAVIGGVLIMRGRR